MSLLPPSTVYVYTNGANSGVRVNSSVPHLILGHQPTGYLHEFRLKIEQDSVWTSGPKGASEVSNLMRPKKEASLYIIKFQALMIRPAPWNLVLVLHIIHRNKIYIYMEW